MSTSKDSSGVDEGSSQEDGDLFSVGHINGSGLYVFRCDGTYLFPLPEHMLKGEKHVDKIKKLKEAKLEDDDVMILAYPKCGTHWVWEVVEMLRSGVIKYHKDVKETRMLEFIFTEGLEAIPSPRILNTHLPLRMLPKQIEEKKIKCIHILRNPKDVCVSMYNMYMCLNTTTYKGDFVEFTDAFLFGKLHYGAYHQYITDLRNELDELKDIPILNIFYEDMKRDPVGCVKQLADFLNLTVTDKFCEDIADACSFKKMKEFETKKEGEQFQFWKEGSGGSFFRKGETGDWKNWFTVAESEKFDQIWNEKMKNFGITFTYSLK